MFKSFEFCLPTNGNKVPAGPEWFHEIKQDGFRIRVERDRVRLISRGGYDWTSRFPGIGEAARKNRCCPGLDLISAGGNLTAVTG
jgi:bifunctional non-homologous end joining protein LigD